MDEITVDEISLSSTDRNGKILIQMHMGPTATEVSFVTPACVTQWPRCTGDGNFGTMFGPAEASKAKFTLDLTDAQMPGDQNNFQKLADKLDRIDDKLLDFVFQNQLKALGRKNLSRAECQMLQIRTVRARYDKASGALNGHTVELKTNKFSYDGKTEKRINICDHEGKVIQNGTVCPGDIVAATIYQAQIYTGVGGDKFGIQWGFEDVSVVCQRTKLEPKSSVPIFSSASYDFATSYEHASDFSDAMAVAS